MSFNLVYACIYSVVLVLLSFIMMIFREETCYNLGNTIVAYIKFMQPAYYPNYDPNNDPYGKMVDLGLMVIFITYFNSMVLSCFCYWMYPRAPMFIGSVIEGAPAIMDLPFSYFIPWFYMIILWANVFDIVGVFYGYGIYIVPFVVKEFNMKRKSYKTIPELREPGNLIPAYRGVQILQQRVNHLAGEFLIPAEAVSTKLVIYSAYVLIKYGKGEKDSVANIVMIMYVVGGLGLWSGILFMGGVLQFYGIKVLNSWKYHQWPNKEQKKLMGKFRKSCKPMQFNYGKTYVIKRLSVLKYLRGLSRGILRALLAL